MILVDTGVLLAAANRHDRLHPAAIDWLAGWQVGVADAIAERLKIATIATFNHRDFRVVRPTHVDAFELVPDIGMTG